MQRKPNFSVEILVVLHRKDLKHNFRRQSGTQISENVFPPRKSEVHDFLHELQRLGKETFETAAQAIFKDLRFLKKNSFFKKSIV